jgi:hypothetical protein
MRSLSLQKKRRIVDKSLIEDIEGFPCIHCGVQADEFHHVKHKGSGGPDLHHNLMPICRVGHQEIHKIGLSKMANKYETIHQWLINWGWEHNGRAWRNSKN